MHQQCGIAAEHLMLYCMLLVGSVSRTTFAAASHSSVFWSSQIPQWDHGCRGAAKCYRVFAFGLDTASWVKRSPCLCNGARSYLFSAHLCPCLWSRWLLAWATPVCRVFQCTLTRMLTEWDGCCLGEILGWEMLLAHDSENGFIWLMGSSVYCLPKISCG